mmetsp:Transcript_22182/g.55293  ORF Transcript_22182/g.55293 Transcript_22182/m.55293 type:complete len:409 (+) Transcript_22182:145-1371(+)
MACLESVLLEEPHGQLPLVEEAPVEVEIRAHRRRLLREPHVDAHVLRPVLARRHHAHLHVHHLAVLCAAFRPHVGHEGVVHLGGRAHVPQQQHLARPPAEGERRGPGRRCARGGRGRRAKRDGRGGWRQHGGGEHLRLRVNDGRALARPHGDEWRRHALPRLAEPLALCPAHLPHQVSARIVHRLRLRRLHLLPRLWQRGGREDRRWRGHRQARQRHTLGGRRAGRRAGRGAGRCRRRRRRHHQSCWALRTLSQRGAPLAAQGRSRRGLHRLAAGGWAPSGPRAGRLLPRSAQGADARGANARREHALQLARLLEQALLLAPLLVVVGPQRVVWVVDVAPPRRRADRLGDARLGGTRRRLCVRDENMFAWARRCKRRGLRDRARRLRRALALPSMRACGKGGVRGGLR